MVFVCIVNNNKLFKIDRNIHMNNSYRFKVKYKMQKTLKNSNYFRDTEESVLLKIPNYCALKNFEMFKKYLNFVPYFFLD